MSKEKRTYGKWLIRDNGGKGELVGIVSDRSNWFIAEEVLRHDAHLICAAPDLLEALETALEWIDAVPLETVLPAMPGFDRNWVNGIIEKVRGESCADNT